MSKAILVATDDSPCARGAAASATALAAILKGRIEALSIVDPVDFGGSAAGAAPELAERQARRAHDQAHAAVDRVAEDARAAGVPVETSVGEGQVRAVLDERARVGDVDLVAAGTHGRTGLDRYLLGSVATHLVRTSPVPVLVVHGAVYSLPTYETVVVPTDGSRHAARAADLGAEIAAASGGTVHALPAAAGPPDSTASPPYPATTFFLPPGSKGTGWAKKPEQKSARSRGSLARRVDSPTPRRHFTAVFGDDHSVFFLADETAVVLLQNRVSVNDVLTR